MIIADTTNLSLILMFHGKYSFFKQAMTVPICFFSPRLCNAAPGHLDIHVVCWKPICRNRFTTKPLTLKRHLTLWRRPHQYSTRDKFRRGGVKTWVVRWINAKRGQ